LARKDDRAALASFREALAAPSDTPRSGLYADAGYAAMRLGRNREAASYLSGAIDEWHAAPPGSKPFDEQTVYDMRRSVDSLERRWGGSFSIGHNSTHAI